jgi:hypothetical protein
MQKDAAHLAAAAATLGLFLGVWLGAVPRSFRAAAMAAPPLSITTFSGGRFDASGVAYVSGTNGVLFIDDGRSEEIFWMRLSDKRDQMGTIRSVSLGTTIDDLEGITTDSTHFYLVGSQSTSKGGDLPGLVRFTFDATREQVGAVESISGLKRFLTDNVADLHGMSDENGGINIEGLAWDPNRQCLLLGLRSPLIEGQALVVPLRLRQADAVFSSSNLEVIDGKAIKLPLGDAGIRSLEYDYGRKLFQVISGAAEDKEALDFRLWEWNGSDTRPELRESRIFDRKLKPEGVTRVRLPSGDFTFIVFDTSRYAVSN